MDDKVGPLSDEEQTKAAKRKSRFVYARINAACWLIIVHELLERFSFYGMKGLLSIFLKEYLGFSANVTTSIYHLFSAIAYLMPVFGAIISDNYWGRFKTVLIFGIVYFIGHLAMPLTTLRWNRVGPLIGMFILAIGTGTIKPCVAAFGGDQTPDDDDEATEAFFSVFYLSINVGAFISQLLTPILKESVDCIDGTCYPLAFGVPAAVFLITYILFLAGKPLYRFLPTESNVCGRMCAMIKHAFSRRTALRKTGDIRDTVYDYADDKYDHDFIRDVKIVMSVLVLYLPFPVFWALFDQQGSRWSLQASQMDGTITSNIRIIPEQMQMVNPLLIIIIIPIFNNVVYPLLGKCNLLTRPPSRIVAGYVLAALSFVYACLLQLRIDAALTVPALPASSSSLHLLNIGPCPVTVTPAGQPSFEVARGAVAPAIAGVSSGNLSLQLLSKCGGQTVKQNMLVPLAAGTNITAGLAVLPDESRFALAPPTQDRQVAAGKAAFKVVMAPDVAREGGLVEAIRNKEKTSRVLLDATNMTYDILQSDYVMLANGDYRLFYRQGNESKQLAGFSAITGTVTTLAVWNTSGVAAMEVVEMRLQLISMFLQLPQYVIMTAAEVLFSVTSMAFAYSESPASMKSICQSLYLVTIFFGNIIVTIVALLPSLPSQAWEFLLFAGLVLVAGAVNGVLAWNFNKNKAKRLAKEQEKEKEDDDKVTAL